MSVRVSVGEAFIDGRYVADIELSEEWVEQAIPVLIPGTNRVDYKDASHAGQAYVQFQSIVDVAVRQRLETLVEFASADLDRKGSRLGL